MTVRDGVHFRSMAFLRTVFLHWPELDTTSLMLSMQVMYVSPRGKTQLAKLEAKIWWGQRSKRQPLLFSYWLQSKQLSSSFYFWPSKMKTYYFDCFLSCFSYEHDFMILTFCCQYTILHAHEYTRMLSFHTQILLFSWGISHNFHNVFYLRLFEVIITFISPQTSWSSNLPCVFI